MKNRKGDSVDQKLLRRIPKVDILLSQPLLNQELKSGISYEIVKSAVTEYLTELRSGILSDKINEIPDLNIIEECIIQRIRQKSMLSLRKVVNATGVVLHTNLGRAPIGEEALKNIFQVAGGYSNLEYDLEQGKRGSRYSHIEKTICRLTGAEAALVVNNNAAAVFIILNTFALNTGVAVSRGELVEIGDSFRIPDIMRDSGARMVEVGTTNKTHLYDYIKAIDDEDVSILMKVHTSNYKVVGFTEEVSVENLVELGKNKGCSVFYDMGSAFPADVEIPGMHQRLTVQKAVASGAELICFSGDKLMGSAQAGIIIGKKELIDRMKKNPLTRMVRIDKMSLAALEWAFRAFLDSAYAVKNVPVMRMLQAGQEELKQKATLLSEMLIKAGAENAVVVECKDEVGGGSLPGVELTGYGVALTKENMTADELEERLRKTGIPIIVRKNEGKVLLSVRTMYPGDEKIICTAFNSIK